MSTETEPIILSHGERSYAMSKNARKAACEDAARHWQRAISAHSNVDQCRIVRLNEFRAVGGCINVACGREQLLFTADGNVFCREHLLPFLPADMSIQAIQGCVHIANRISKPVQTVAEVNVAEKLLQEEFALLGLAESHKRRELQTSHARNLFSDYVNRIAGMTVLFDELDKEEPMDQWPPDKLDEFLQTAQPVKEKIERAEKLRLGIVPKI